MALIAGYLSYISVTIAAWGKRELLVSSVTGQALQLSKDFQVVHHVNATLLSNKFYHGTVETLFGRNQCWSSILTSHSMWEWQQRQIKSAMAMPSWGLNSSRGESPEPQQAASSSAEPSIQEETHFSVTAFQEGDSMASMLELNQKSKDERPGVLLLSRGTDVPYFDIMLLIHNQIQLVN